MDRPECRCDEKDGEKSCQTCNAAIALPYWCETCERLVAEKRCLGCGLKARKVRRPGPKTSPE
jgi:predicted RNA-binding protein with PUA domain